MAISWIEDLRFPPQVQYASRSIKPVFPSLTFALERLYDAELPPEHAPQDESRPHGGGEQHLLGRGQVPRLAAEQLEERRHPVLVERGLHVRPDGREAVQAPAARVGALPVAVHGGAGVQLVPRGAGGVGPAEGRKGGEEVVGKEALKDLGIQKKRSLVSLQRNGACSFDFGCTTYVCIVVHNR